MWCYLLCRGVGHNRRRGGCVHLRMLIHLLNFWHDYIVIAIRDASIKPSSQHFDTQPPAKPNFDACHSHQHHASQWRQDNPSWPIMHLHVQLSAHLLLQQLSGAGPQGERDTKWGAPESGEKVPGRALASRHHTGTSQVESVCCVCGAKRSRLRKGCAVVLHYLAGTISSPSCHLQSQPKP